jgi:Spy/CpxP family protein refolding chaperone
MRYALVAVALLASAAAFADCGGHGRGDHMAQLKQELNLTDDQATQVEQVLRAQHDKARAVMQTQMEAIHQDTLNQLRGVLTEEQVQTFESHMNEMKERWHGQHGDAPEDDAGQGA